MDDPPCLRPPSDRSIIGWISLADVLIAVAYFIIPAELAYFWWQVRRRNVMFKGVLLLFVMFIVLCGFTHLTMAYFFYHQIWVAQVLIKVATALVSLATAVVLYDIIPRLLSLPIQISDLETNLEQRLIVENDLRSDIVGQTLLRKIIHDLRGQLDKRSLVTATANAVTRDLKANSVSIFINRSLVFSHPRSLDTREIDIPYDLESTLTSTGVTTLQHTTVRTILGIEPIPETIWYCGRFVEASGFEQRGVGYLFVEFKNEARGITYPDMIFDVIEQLENSLRLVNLLEVDQQRIGQLAVQNENLLRARREAQTATEDARDWLSVVSHEMRTPLFAIVAMVGLALERKVFVNPIETSPELAQIKEDLTIVKRAGDQLVDIINNMLDVAKYEAHELELNNEPFILREAFEQAMETVLFQNEQRPGPIISLDLSPNTSPWAVIGDNMRLKQIILNLVSNAVKFTPDEGHVKVQVSTTMTTQSNVKLTVTVADDGIGIPLEHQQKLFKKFSQTDSSLTRKYQGIGLGLAICKNLCTLMGGDIFYEPNQPKGSKFIFTVYLSNYDGLDVSLMPAKPVLNAKSIKVYLNQLDNDDEEILIDLFNFLGVETTNNNQSTASVHDILKMHKGGHLDDFKQLVEKYPMTTLGIASPFVFKQKLLEGLDHVRTIQRPFPLKALTNWVNQATNGDGGEGTSSNGKTTQEPASTLPKLKILVAEDNSVNRFVIERILVKLGQEVAFAENGQEAVNMYKDNYNTKDDKNINNVKPFDVVLMDVMMPVMDGYEAAKLIRNLSKKPTQPWIITLTGTAFYNDRVRSEQAGMNDFLSKPVTKATLEKALLKAVESSKQSA